MSGGLPSIAEGGTAEGGLLSADGGSLSPDGGSFRDPCGRIYHHSDGRVLRAVDAKTAHNLHALQRQPFFQRWVAAGEILAAEAAEVSVENWHSVFSHPPLPFITYPYEWTFSMLKEAALLQLRLQEEALQNGWTFKDATPYNIQWQGARAVFIDVASLQPAEPGAAWAGYRQFCMLFLYPLLLRAHLGIDFDPLLRADLDGIAPAAAAKYFYGWRRFFKRGVLSHVVFPAIVEQKIAGKERDRAPAKKRAAFKQSPAMQFGLLSGLIKTVRGLRLPPAHTAWSHYAGTHSYSTQDYAAKKEFVLQVAREKQRKLVWDLGANTGTFAKLCAPHAECVVAADGDRQAVEFLYHEQRKQPQGNIIPLYLNLANSSPDQGFGGRERKAFDKRGAPALILCLALVHHLRISANIPVALFLDWLLARRAACVVEFVGRDDEMTQKLLLNKKETYDDYTRDNFHAEAAARFDIRKTLSLKNGQRILYYLTPKQGG